MMRLEKMFAISAVMGIALATGACSEHSLDLWQKSHKAEGPGFGDAHRQIMAKHIVNPEPAKPADTDSAVEAERTSVGIGLYLKGGATSGKGAGAGAKKITP
jgi:type IV pilus biogenesis protein CpaD/CtpE